MNANCTQEFSGNSLSKCTHICYTKELFPNYLCNHVGPHRNFATAYFWQKEAMLISLKLRGRPFASCHFEILSSTARLRIWTLRIWGFRGPGFRSARQVLCGDASRLFLDHFSKHLSSVLGRTELCHEVRNPGPQNPKSSTIKTTTWHCLVLSLCNFATHEWRCIQCIPSPYENKGHSFHQRSRKKRIHQRGPQTTKKEEKRGVSEMVIHILGGLKPLLVGKFGFKISRFPLYFGSKIA